MLTVVVSGVLVRMAPSPLPLVQIALGALIATATDFRIAPDPDVFFLLFLPPLLFLDNWRIPPAWSACASRSPTVTFTRFHTRRWTSVDGAWRHRLGVTSLITCTKWCIGVSFGK